MGSELTVHTKNPVPCWVTILAEPGIEVEAARATYLLAMFIAPSVNVIDGKHNEVRFSAASALSAVVGNHLSFEFSPVVLEVDVVRSLRSRSGHLLLAYLTNAIKAVNPAPVFRERANLIAPRA